LITYYSKSGLGSINNLALNISYLVVKNNPVFSEINM